MSDSNYKDVDERKKMEDVLNDLHQARFDDAGKTVDKALEKERAKELRRGSVSSAPKANGFSLKGVLAIPVFICLLIVSWFISVQLLFWLFPMPHSTRRIIAFVPAFILAFSILFLIDGLISKSERRKR